MKKKIQNWWGKGFTLAELLIVVAIIGVLVAISIPIFSHQLHKARVAIDWANVRSYYSQLQYDFLETEKINNAYLHEPNGTGTDGIKSFNLSGETVKLKAGSIWIRREDGESAGYNILYECDKWDTDCELILPVS